MRRLEKLVLLLAAVTAACGPARAQDRWTQLPQQGLPFDREAVADVQVDTGKNIYVLADQKVFRLTDGRFAELRAPFAGFGLGGFAAQSAQSFWMLGRISDSIQGSQIVLLRNLNGVWSRFDSTSTCLRGNYFNLLGMDAQGNAIVDMRYFAVFGGPSFGVHRVKGNTCEEIDVGIAVEHSEEGATRYYRDARGWEYFAKRLISDILACNGFARLNPGTRLFGKNLCVDGFLARGDSLLMATDRGLGLQLDDSLTFTDSLKNRPLSLVSAILGDSRGSIWLGTQGQDLSRRHVLLARIAGRDTVLTDRSGSGFPSDRVRKMVEDGSGNIWFLTGEPGLTILVRAGNTHPVSLRPGPALRRAGGITATPSVDGLGRPASGRRPPARLLHFR